MLLQDRSQFLPTQPEEDTGQYHIRMSTNMVCLLTKRDCSKANANLSLYDPYGSKRQHSK